MNLSRDNLKNISTATVRKPDETIFELPEKVLQFGTGVLLRGLPDYFIDKANRKGIFNGRAIVVKSTDEGNISVFREQDNLYTLCIRGVSDGKKAEENIVCSAISRVLSAKQQWDEVLECAHNPSLQIIISNTTEAGIQLINEDINQSPPRSFPAKLTAFLYERYKAFSGSSDSGMIIIPTELITDNAKKLAFIVSEIAKFNQLEEAFIYWLNDHNRFCNSLVDRIVPGKPDFEMKQRLEKELGYSDDLITVCETYRLWAIEGDEFIRSALSFAEVDKAIIIKRDIEIYKELKLRMLNATHTLICGLAHLSGFETVKNSMDDNAFVKLIEELMLKEIAPAIPYPLPDNAALNFGLQVLDRFRNPYIHHRYLNITLHYSLKMKMRVIPIILKHYQLFQSVPPKIATCFAAYLVFMRTIKKEEDKYFGERNGKLYLIPDNNAAWFYEVWKTNDISYIVNTVLSNETLWDTDLLVLNGFVSAVEDQLRLLI